MKRVAHISEAMLEDCTFSQNKKKLTSFSDPFTPPLVGTITQTLGLDILRYIL